MSRWKRFRRWLRYHLYGNPCRICGFYNCGYRRDVCDTCRLIEAIKGLQ